jgi:NTP pyrophosphatase (non-canonical NTP hydrolase)
MAIDQELLKRAIEKWGFDTQADMLLEECSELIHAICKFKRVTPPVDPNTTADLLDNLCEEIADVKILIAQFETDPIYEQKVSMWTGFKMRRLEKWLSIDNGT